MGTATQAESKNDLLTTAEASEIVGIAASTLTVWRSHKKGPDYCKIGGKVRYRRGDLQAFLEKSVRRARE